MIEPTHIQLDRAAETLGVDADELLLAAFERKLTLYALCDVLVDAECGKLTGNDWAWKLVDAGLRPFPFVPLAYSDAAKLRSTSHLDVTTTILSDQDAEGYFWVSTKGPITITVERSQVFVRREDLPASPKALDKPSVQKAAPKDKSLLATIAALLAAWPGGTIPSCKELEKAAQSVGLDISDDTIRKSLKAAKDVAASLPAPK